MEILLRKWILGIVTVTIATIVMLNVIVFMIPINDATTKKSNTITILLHPATSTPNNSHKPRGIMIFGMFIVGYDQGHLFSLAQGDQAFDTMWMHEFYHDMRHSAAFPCH